MTFLDFINKINDYDSEGFHKLADKMTEKLIKISVDISDINNPTLKLYLDRAERNKFMQVIDKIPECAAITNTPSVSESIFDAYLKAKKQNKKIEDTLIDMDVDLTLPGTLSCLNAISDAGGLDAIAATPTTGGEGLSTPQAAVFSGAPKNQTIV
jgi:hypothetical protein